MKAALPPLRLASPCGLAFQLNANGSLHRIEQGDILLNLFPGNEVEGGPANLYLRRHGATMECMPLLGPRSLSSAWFAERKFQAQGEWQGIRYAVALILAESAPAWFWQVSLENLGPEPVDVDLIYAQDLGLAQYWAVRLNEYYISQYVDYTPLAHPEHGVVMAARQNQSMGGKYPWCVIGALGQGASYATDALQVYGLGGRSGSALAGIAQGLPGNRLQHEHSMAAIQDSALRLEPGQRAERGFFGGFVPDHPAATGPDDLALVDEFLALPEAQFSAVAWEGAGSRAAASLFASAAPLAALNLSDADLAEQFAQGWRAVERDGEGWLLSFFADERTHVVLKAKELRVLRPHGHMLRTGASLIPDESALTSTTWMGGVFHSMLTQGHVSINRFLSTTHSYLGLFRSHGQRVFVELAEGWHLLELPSAYAMAPDGCRWLYRHAGGLIEVRATVASRHHALGLSVAVLEGGPLRFLVSHHLALNGDDGAGAVPARYQQDAQGVWLQPVPESELGVRFPEGGFRIDFGPGCAPEQVGGDELLFADGQSRNQPFLCLCYAPTVALELTITGHLVAAEPPQAALDPSRYWQAMTAGLRFDLPASSPLAGDAANLAEILPWFAHNALVHYLSPRGLEQYSGGGWGTRDVSQGPVELLLSLGKPEPVRDLLIRVFKQQNPDGDWPQWFMFFERERGIRPGDSHGDIVFWPLLALAQYLIATEDAAFISEVIPFFHADPAQAEHATLDAHVERALGVVARRTIPGTRLAAYGHGDWNDSLQPVDPAMRERLCSAWTVTLHYQVLKTLAQAMRRLGYVEPAARFTSQAEAVRADFQKRLIVDGVLAGFAYFHEDGRAEALLHPADQATGLRYSLLPMVHAIANGLLDPEQAARHLALIEAHLLGPDGARLFDRPMEYRGGLQRIFQRAESSSFFGREIGLMYTHAHLRYAEALAHYGQADAFFAALCRANPIGLAAHVPTARPRQANCYYSSSDAAFADRYQAQARYAEALRGAVDFEGGWRVYSSGAGIAVGLVMRCLLGLRQEKSWLVVDPVLPSKLDGLVAELELAGRTLRVSYRVGARGCGVVALRLNGVELPFAREANPYRPGAAMVAWAEWQARLADGGGDELAVVIR